MRILFLSGWYPYPADNGSKIRIYNLLRELAQHHEVSLITFADQGLSVDLEALKPYCCVVGVLQKLTFQPTRLKAIAGFLNRAPRSVVDTYSNDMAAAISRAVHGSRYDAVVASQFVTASYLADVHSLPKIFEEIETTVIKEEYTHAASPLTRFRKSLTWTKTRRYIGWLMQQFDAGTVASKLEQMNLRELAPNYNRVELIPNGVDIEWLQPGMTEPQSHSLVFNGALTFSANFDAMRYFLNDIWPGIKTSEPAASLKITGRTEGVNLQNLALSNGVTLTGYLSDIRPTVANAWACVVPLRIGGGTRLKILEAMALGTPVIATTKGAEGLAVTPESDILLADEPAQFVTQTMRLMHDGQLRKRLSENGRRLVEEQYSWHSIGRQFNQLVERVVEGRRGH